MENPPQCCCKHGHQSVNSFVDLRSWKKHFQFTSFTMMFLMYELKAVALVYSAATNRLGWPGYVFMVFFND